MKGYVRRVLGAHFRSGRALYLLTVAGVTIGVASVLSVQIINRNAVAAFAGTVDAVSGGADLSIVGTGADLADSNLIQVLETAGVFRAWPMIRADVLLPALDRRLDIVGVDMLSPPAGLTADATALDGAALAVPGWIAVSRIFADEHGLAPGDSLTASFGMRRTTLRIGRVYHLPAGTPLASRRLAFMDIANAQAQFGRAGRVHQIDVLLHSGVDADALVPVLQARLGPGVRVTTPDTIKSEAAGLLSAFRLNLSALSMISVLVGLFLVYSATHAALQRRRKEFGILRSVGMSRAQVLGLVLVEVSFLGALGVALGIPLGYFAARANIDSVSATLTNLYLLEAIESVQAGPGLLWLAAAVGIGGALLGALVPAVEMCWRNPSELLQRTGRRRPRAAPGIRGVQSGSALAIGLAIWYRTTGYTWPPAGFVLCLGVVLCVPLVAPWLIHRTGRLMPARTFGVRHAIRSMSTSVRSVTVAISALGVAVTMLVGVTLMIQSFRRTLDEWMGAAVQADVYVSAEAWRGRGAEGSLDSSVVSRLGSFPAVRAIDLARGFRGRADGRDLTISGFQFGEPGGPGRFQLITGDVSRVFAPGSRRALVSEPLARKMALSPGDTLRLATPSGPMPLVVAGVYYDYGNEQGAVATALDAIATGYGPASPSGVALYLAPDRDAQGVIDELERAFDDIPIMFRANGTIRMQALAVFDQTFAITLLLQGLSLLIAAVGVTITLLVIARDRLAELALYRSIGATRRQIFRLFVGKGLGISTLGIVLGTAGGFVLAWILINVINRTYFGWTIHADWSPAGLVIPLLTVTGAACLASIYPAIRAARIPAAELRYDDA